MTMKPVPTTQLRPQLVVFPLARKLVAGPLLAVPEQPVDLPLLRYPSYPLAAEEV